MPLQLSLSMLCGRLMIVGEGLVVQFKFLWGTLPFVLQPDLLWWQLPPGYPFSVNYVKLKTLLYGPPGNNRQNKTSH